MTTIQFDHQPVGSTLRVSVVCFRWNGIALETIITGNGDLPGTVPDHDETLEGTAARIIAGLFDQPAAYIEQLYTFSHTEDNRRQTLVTYLVLFQPDSVGVLPWRPLSDLAPLTHRDATVLEYASSRLRAKLEYTSIAFHLMPACFTLAELQRAFESILDEQLDKRNFRRRMTTSSMLTETGEKRREGPHRPAALYRFSGTRDRSSYLTPMTTQSQESPS